MVISSSLTPGPKRLSPAVAPAAAARATMPIARRCAGKVRERPIEQRMLHLAVRPRPCRGDARLSILQAVGAATKRGRSRANRLDAGGQSEAAGRAVDRSEAEGRALGWQPHRKPRHIAPAFGLRQLLCVEPNDVGAVLGEDLREPRDETELVAAA